MTGTNMQLQQVAEQLYTGNVGKAIAEMETYLAAYPQQQTTEKLKGIKTEYQLMEDYWRKGVVDPQLTQLYQHLLQRLYVLFGNVASYYHTLSHPTLSGIYSRVRLEHQDWSLKMIRKEMEDFVSSVAMLEFEAEQAREEKKELLYRNHQLQMNALFNYILTSRMWSDGVGHDFEEMLISPTIDGNDQQLLVSAVTLSLLNQFDMAKFRTLVNVYRRSQEEAVRQRALVGWVLAMDDNVDNIYPEQAEIVAQLLKSEKACEELTELQMQLIYCLNAEKDTKTIQKVDFYLNDELIKTMTEAPYVLEVSSSKTGWNNTKAVVTATDGSTYERYGRFNVVSGSAKHEPYGEVPELPGTIKVEEYDKGVSGTSYSNATRNTSTAMKTDQWMDYTVDVKEDGDYSFDVTVASTTSNGRFHLAEYGLDSLSYLTEFVEVPKTGGANEWKTLHGRLTTKLTAGRHVFTLLVEQGGFYIKDITFSRYEEAGGTCMLKPFSGTFGVGDNVVVSAKVTSKVGTMSEMRFYADNMLIGTATESPYECIFTPTEKRTYSIVAIAVNTEGQEKMSSVCPLKVTSDTPVGIETIVGDEPEPPAYNLMGMPVGDGYRGIVIKSGKKHVRR